MMEIYQPKVFFFVGFYTLLNPDINNYSVGNMALKFIPLCYRILCADITGRASNRMAAIKGLITQE